MNSPSCHFAYIDILGFRNLIKAEPEKVDELFRRIDNLNAHVDSFYKVIVFSDTILIYNKANEAEQIHFGKSILMFLIEFTTDLLMSVLDLNIHFRALIIKGEFNFKAYKNIDAYYGQALISTYDYESKIKGIGIFLHNTLASENVTFNSVFYDTEYRFILPFRSLSIIKDFGTPDFPIKEYGIFEQLSELKETVQYFKLLFDYSQNISLKDEVREKYTITYKLYKDNYLGLVQFLEENNFDHTKIPLHPNWAADDEPRFYSSKSK